MMLILRCQCFGEVGSVFGLPYLIKLIGKNPTDPLCRVVWCMLNQPWSHTSTFYSNTEVMYAGKAHVEMLGSRNQ